MLKWKRMEYRCGEGHRWLLSAEDDSAQMPRVTQCPFCFAASVPAGESEEFKTQKDTIERALHEAWKTLDDAAQIADSLWPSRIIATRIRALRLTLDTLRDYIILMQE